MRFRLDLPDAEVLTTPDQVEELAEDLMGHQGVVAYDTETSGLEWDRVCYTIQFAYRSHTFGPRRIVVPTYKPEQLLAFKILKPWFERRYRQKVAHNEAYDRPTLRRHGVKVEGLYADTMKMHHLYEDWEEHGLKTLAWRFLRLNLKSFKDVFGKNMTRTLVAEVFEDPNRRAQAVEYASLDPWATLELYEYLYPRLEEEPWSPPDSIREIVPPPANGEFYTMWEQHALLDVVGIEDLCRMTERGVPIDLEVLESKGLPMREEAARITHSVAKDYHMAINLASAPQVSQLLFQVLNHRPVEKTATGYSTNEKTLKVLRERGCPVSQRILDFRRVSKLNSTYVVGLADATAKDGRIHSTLTAMATTHRLRSANPNMQNLPNAEGDVFLIREAIVAPPGFRLFCGDYSGLEMRIMAGLAQEPSMLRIFRDGLDVHVMTCAEMYDVPYEDIILAVKKYKAKKELTKGEHQLVELRSAAKITGFGIMYGRGPKGLAEQLMDVLKRFVSKEEGEDLIARFYNVRPMVKKFLDEKIRLAYETGVVETILGRKRRVVGLFSHSRSERNEAERQVMNLPIQGSAADLLLVAMREIETDPFLNETGASTILQVHDELLALLHEGVAQECGQRMADIMEFPKGWPGLPGVDLKVEWNLGSNWVEAK